MSDNDTSGSEREPITCNNCGDELPFAFEDQRDTITCMKCVRADSDTDDGPDLPTIKGRKGTDDLGDLNTGSDRS